MNKSIKTFFSSPISGGIILLLVTAIAMILENTEASSFYHGIVHYSFFSFEGHSVNMHFIANDILMPIFFLLVGLEIKREFLEGELSGKGAVFTPIMSALGGVIVPAIVYYFLNKSGMIGGVNNEKGWAIPTATDIAFALGVLALFGSKVPLFLKVFLTALAIIDDLIAIIIIALFYSEAIHYIYILGAAGAIISLIILNKFKVEKIVLYLVIGIILWYLILHSGIHVTIAGVVLGLTIPLNTSSESSLEHKEEISHDDDNKCLLKSLEHTLVPWVKFFILPIFAFINSGVSFNIDSNVNLFTNNVTMGIFFGLFLGKQLGIFGTVRILYLLKLAKKPDNVNYIQIYGVSILAGIGFTMSFFITDLAFGDVGLLPNLSKMGIILGSVISAIVGGLFLFIGNNRRVK